MSEIKWIKLSTMMFDDEKIKLIESMPEKDAILVIWIKLLSQAGKCNASGYLILNEKIPYTDEMLATIFNRPLNVVRLALETFKKFGMIEFEDNLFRIADWEYTQNIEGMEKIRKQNAERQRRFKENKRKLLETKKSNVTDNVKLTLDNATEQEQDLELDLKEQQHITENKKKVNTKSKKNNSNSKDVVVVELKNKIESVIKSTIKPKGFNRLLRDSDIDTINLYLDNWDKFNYANKDNKTGFFIDACINKYDIPVSEKGTTTRNKPTQATNYEQRKYDDDFFDSLYDNVEYMKNKDDGG